MGLDQIKNSGFEMAQLLAKNKDIQKLLYIDSDDIDMLDNKKYVDILPTQPNWFLENSYIKVETPVELAAGETIDRNTVIFIRLDDFTFHMSDNNVASWGFIDIITNENHVLLTNNRSRLLELVNLVVKTLDGKKLSAAGEVEISSASFSVYSPNLFGWRMRFSLKDTSTYRQAEI